MQAGTSMSISPERFDSITATMRQAGVVPARHMGLTYDEAAVVMGYSPRKVWQLVRDGKLRAIRDGGTVRITAEDIQRYQERAKTQLAPGW
jgi:excisionase family DNA binding protein